jgi:hypothetical protein
MKSIINVGNRIEAARDALCLYDHMIESASLRALKLSNYIKYSIKYQAIGGSRYSEQ